MGRPSARHAVWLVTDTEAVPGSSPDDSSGSFSTHMGAPAPRRDPHRTLRGATRRSLSNGHPRRLVDSAHLARVAARWTIDEHDGPANRTRRGPDTSVWSVTGRGDRRRGHPSGHHARPGRPALCTTGEGQHPKRWLRRTCSAPRGVAQTHRRSHPRLVRLHHARGLEARGSVLPTLAAAAGPGWHTGRGPRRLDRRARAQSSGGAPHRGCRGGPTDQPHGHRAGRSCGFLPRGRWANTAFAAMGCAHRRTDRPVVGPGPAARRALPCRCGGGGDDRTGSPDGRTTVVVRRRRAPTGTVDAGRDHRRAAAANPARPGQPPGHRTRRRSDRACCPDAQRRTAYHPRR